MEANQLVTASFDDIIFEGRHKAYGAYQLRRQYNDRMSKAAAISFSSILFLFGLGYAAVQMKPDLVEDLVPPKLGPEVFLQPEPVFEEVKPPKAAAAPAAVTPTATRQFIQPRVVPEEEPVAADIPSQADFTAADPGLATVAGTPSEGTAGTPDAAAGDGAGAGETVALDKPFDFVEQMPEFADGGQAGLLKFIGKHLRYPGRAVNEGLEGVVVVSFVVSPSGEVTQVTVLKDLGGGTGEEAVRVLSKMPRWKPGVQNHRHVPVRMTLPIRFKLGNA
jgi:periplasmic protein TonB